MKTPIYGLVASQPKDVYSYLREQQGLKNLLGTITRSDGKTFETIDYSPTRGNMTFSAINGLDVVVSDAIATETVSFEDGTYVKYNLVTIYSAVFAGSSQADLRTELDRAGYTSQVERTATEAQYVAAVGGTGSYSAATSYHRITVRAGAGVWTTTGGRMDRQFAGAFTVGGRGSNRSFHGKVASMVVTTLKQDAAPFPSNEEIKVMVTDPVRWIQDYKVGETFRPSYYSTNSNWDTASGSSKASGSQVWLMGDGTSDAYAKIRNQVFDLDQNYTPLDMISMVSNDIETVSIPGLS